MGGTSGSRMSGGTEPTAVVNSSMIYGQDRKGLTKPILWKVFGLVLFAITLSALKTTIISRIQRRFEFRVFMLYLQPRNMHVPIPTHGPQDVQYIKVPHN